MKKYEMLPISKLVSDVPVDPLHTKELADSIMTKGQLAPVIIREETREVIDGFHRIAAMKELGFDQVEGVLTPCDDEGFWDFRIIQASLHKNVTFARAIDWMDKIFALSPWKDKYKNSHILFEKARDKTAPQEVQDWAAKKAKTWGLAVSTIAEWLETKEKLQPDVLDEARKGGGAPLTHYREIAHSLPARQDLQRPLIEKAKQEDLTQSQIRTVAQALRRAEDTEEVQSILRQPVSRTEDQLVRDAKVEKLLAHPREITPMEERAEAMEKDTLYKIDLMGIIHSSNAITREKIDALTPAQKEDLYATCEQSITGIKRVMDMLKPGITAEYQLREG